MIKHIIKISTFATFQQPYMDHQEIYNSNSVIVRVHHTESIPSKSEEEI